MGLFSKKYVPISKEQAQNIISRIKYPGTIYTVVDDSKICIYMNTIDSQEGYKATVRCEYSDYTQQYGEKAFVKFVWECTQHLILHEAAEWFKYNDTRPFYPHERK